MDLSKMSKRIYVYTVVVKKLSTIMLQIIWLTGVNCILNTQTLLCRAVSEKTFRRKDCRKTIFA